MTDIKQYIAQKAEGIVNGARRGAYGTPENNFHRIAIMWQAWFDAHGWQIRHDTEHNSEVITFDASMISPMMRLMKEARLVETPNHLDSFIDIVGYALTGAEVNQVQVPNDEPLTQDQMAEFKRKFGELLIAKDNRIAELEKQLDLAVRTAQENEVKAGLQTASTRPIEPSSPAAPLRTGIGGHTGP